jgi:hypothetical protein
LLSAGRKSISLQKINLAIWYDSVGELLLFVAIDITAIKGL